MKKELDGNMLDFGDYCIIEQKRYGGDNEMYIYKVINQGSSNSYVDVPVDARRGGEIEITHKGTFRVISCIRCGVHEVNVRKFRIEEVKLCKPSKKN